MPCIDLLRSVLKTRIISRVKEIYAQNWFRRCQSRWNYQIIELMPHSNVNWGTIVRLSNQTLVRGIELNALNHKTNLKKIVTHSYAWPYGECWEEPNNLDDNDTIKVNSLLAKDRPITKRELRTKIFEFPL